MSKNNIIELRKKEVTTDDMLEEAKGVFVDSLLIGWDKNDELSVWVSKDFLESEINWAIDILKQRLLSREFS